MFYQDATFYAQAIKAGRLNIRDLVKEAIHIIQEQNPTLNALVSLQETYAMNLAQEYASKLIKMSDTERVTLPPFYGVPILLKDLGQTHQGFPATSGSRLLADYKADHTDYFVQKIIDAGFIIVGRTNTPEFGFKNISDAQIHGVVNSPLDTRRNPGGSSGGAAAALKAGWVPIVTASDGGGSIRIPASFSGLIGLKPSRGRMPVGPGNYRSWQGSSVNFVLSKSIRDTWTLLQWMQVDQREAPFSLPLIDKEHLTIPQRPLKIAYSLTTLFDEYDVPKETQEGLLQTVNILKSMGHTLIEENPAIDGRKMMESYYLINGGVETAAMLLEMESVIGRPLSNQDMEAMSWATYQYGLNIPAYDMSQTLTYWDQMTAVMEDFYQDYDVWLTPTTNGPAPTHGQFLLEDRFIEKLSHAEDYSVDEQKNFIWQMFDESLAWTPYTQLMNLTGQPAISLPIFENHQDLPIGMQFAAGKGQEYLLLSLGLQLEEAGYLHSEIHPIP